MDVKTKCTAHTKLAQAREIVQHTEKYIRAARYDSPVCKNLERAGYNRLRELLIGNK